MKWLPKILVSHPLVGLCVIIAYIAFSWWFTVDLWQSGSHWGSPLFALAITVGVKLLSPHIIKEMKKAKVDSR